MTKIQLVTVRCSGTLILTPDPMSQLLHENQLLPHQVHRHPLAPSLAHTSKSTLRTNTKRSIHNVSHSAILSTRDNLSSSVNTSNHFLDILQIRLLGRHNAKHDILPNRQMPKWLKVPCSLGVILKVVSIVV